MMAIFKKTVLDILAGRPSYYHQIEYHFFFSPFRIWKPFRRSVGKQNKMFKLTALLFRWKALFYMFLETFTQYSDRKI